MFYGAGGETLGKHGKSKDHRPDLRQVIVGVVLDSDGRPVCSEIWPGNAADVKALLPVDRRLRERFAITRMCLCADRGMISAETMAQLEAHGIEYILGARERSDPEVRDLVLADDKPMVAMVIPRARGKETTLEVKEVMVGDWGADSKPRRYIVCFNPEEAQRDAETRAATPRAAAAWCHVSLIFPDSRCRSNTCRLTVFNLSHARAIPSSCRDVVTTGCLRSGIRASDQRISRIMLLLSFS
jgi:hypothetical protein